MARKNKVPLKIPCAREAILKTLSTLIGLSEGSVKERLVNLHSKISDANFFDIQALVHIGSELNNLCTDIQEVEADFASSTYFEYASSILTLHVISSAGGGPAEFIKLIQDMNDKKAKKLLS